MNIRSGAGPFLPPALRPGSRIALVSPAGPSTPARIEGAIARCRSLGFEPVAGRHAGARHGYLAGSDDDRLSDLQYAVEDAAVDAIWAIRGGYGTMRLLDRIDLEPLHRRPKAYIGFSDNTAVHLALDRLGVVSFHGVHAGGEFEGVTERCLLDVVCHDAPAGLLPIPDGCQPESLCAGTARGRLIGGNLAMLAAACGTPWALNAAGRILFIEDVNEPAYRVDRALTQLRLAGCLDRVAGIAFGQFNWTTVRPDSEPPIVDVLADLVAPLGVPVLSGLPFGHVDEQWCLPVGVEAELDTRAGTLELLQPAVSGS